MPFEPSPFPALSRRHLLRAGSAVLAGFDLLPSARLRAAIARKVEPLGSADFCIFVFLGGGLSHVDSFDLKEGPWTPQDFDIRTVAPGLRLPVALFPKLSAAHKQYSIVRSMETWESEHGRATYYLHSAHPPSPARLAEIPALGAVVAYELESKRRPDDVLPPFVSLNYGPDQTKQGFLDSRFAPLNFTTDGSFDFVVPDAQRFRFNQRLKYLRELESMSGSPLGTAPGPNESQIRTFRDSSLKMMEAAELKTVLRMEDADRARYGASRLADACVLARNIVAAGRGTRFIAINQGGWDFHTNIYERKQKSNQYTKSLELDAAVSALLTDLANQRNAAGRSLLDRTLIVIAGEFGRTTGPITVGKGRDHHRFAMSALFAGGGVQGGRVIGATDGLGTKVVDPGWSAKRSAYPEDVASTIYSALGIDWTKKLSDTPSGRVFEYVEPQSGTNFFQPTPIAELFT